VPLKAAVARIDRSVPVGGSGSGPWASSPELVDFPWENGVVFISGFSLDKKGDFEI